MSKKHRKVDKYYVVEDGKIKTVYLSFDMYCRWLSDSKKKVFYYYRDAVDFLSDKFDCQIKQIEELKQKIKELDEFLDAGTMINKGLNSMNKALTEERNNYRNMVFDQKDTLNKAKDLLRRWVSLVGFKVEKLTRETEQFLKEDGQ